MSHHLEGIAHVPGLLLVFRPQSRPHFGLEPASRALARAAQPVRARSTQPGLGRTVRSNMSAAPTDARADALSVSCHVSTFLHFHACSPYSAHSAVLLSSSLRSVLLSALSAKFNKIFSTKLSFCFRFLLFIFVS